MPAVTRDQSSYWRLCHGGATMTRMREDELGILRCVLCDAALTVPDGTEPRITIEGVGGAPTQRVLWIEGKEIHRCANTVRNN
jgi:hypothetical protein